MHLPPPANSLLPFTSLATWQDGQLGREVYNYIYIRVCMYMYVWVLHLCLLCIITLLCSPPFEHILVLSLPLLLPLLPCFLQSFVSPPPISPILPSQGRIVCAPFFDVTFADFWIADQLTSLGLALLDTEFFWCYMFFGIHAPGQFVSPLSVCLADLRFMLISGSKWGLIRLQRWFSCHPSTCNYMYTLHL